MRCAYPATSESYTENLHNGVSDTPTMGDRAQLAASKRVSCSASCVYPEGAMTHIRLARHP